MGNFISNITLPIDSQSNCEAYSQKKFALGIIDPQNDFFEGGSLAINGANSIIEHINMLRFQVFNNMDTFISLDFHPHDHMSFAQTHGVEQFTKKTIECVVEDKKLLIEQDMWPTHCVANTFGACVHENLIVNYNDKFFCKGTKSMIESYSAFGDEFSNTLENTGLDNWLKTITITDIVLVGLATDYCVFNTGKDAIRYGYRVHIILSCVRGVSEESTTLRINQLKSLGVLFYEDVQTFKEYYLSVMDFPKNYSMLNVV